MQEIKYTFIRETDVTIIKANHPRLLLVGIRNKFIDIFVVVAHAPHSGDTPEARNNFFLELDACIGNRSNVILFID